MSEASGLLIGWSDYLCEQLPTCLIIVYRKDVIPLHAACVHCQPVPQLDRQPTKPERKGRLADRRTERRPLCRESVCFSVREIPVILHTGFVLPCWNGQILICVSPSLPPSLSALPACLSPCRCTHDNRHADWPTMTDVLLHSLLLVLQ